MFIPFLGCHCPQVIRKLKEITATKYSWLKDSSQNDSSFSGRRRRSGVSKREIGVEIFSVISFAFCDPNVDRLNIDE